MTVASMSRTSDVRASVSIHCNLLIEPDDYVTFVLPHLKPPQQIQSIVTLTNISPKKTIIVKVRTTNAQIFTTSPAITALEPGESRIVIITLLPIEWKRLLSMPSRMEWNQKPHRFLLQSIEIEESMTMYTSAMLSDWWKTCSKAITENRQLFCHYIEGNAVEYNAIIQRRKFEFERIANESCLEILNQDYLQEKPYRESVNAVCESDFLSARDHLSMTDDLEEGFSIFPEELLTFTVSSQSSSGGQTNCIDYLVPLECRADGENILSETNLKLCNKSFQFMIYQIKTTNHRGYYVKPSKGYVLPNQSLDIPIQLVQRDDSIFDSLKRESIDRFQVLILFVEKNQMSEVLQEKRQSKSCSNAIAKLWKEQSPAKIIKTELLCQIKQICAVDAVKGIRLQKSLSSILTIPTIPH